jgi:hypothetical protein
MVNLSTILVLLVLLLSCGKSSDQKIADAALSADIALGTGDCQSAIDILEGHGRVNTSARYLKTLASAYACRSGYSTITLFGSDISKTIVPTPLGGLTKYTTSTTTPQNPIQNDPKFKDLQTAIDILLYAGGISTTTEPTTTERKKYFSSAVVGDIDAQLLYMMLVQLGKYMALYGDADTATGAKAGGAAANNCFTDYPNVDGGGAGNITTALALLPGSCQVKTSSHLQLDSSLVTTTTRKTRLCQGVVLLNGVLSLLPNVVSSLFSVPADQAAALAALALVDTVAKAALTAAYPAIGQVLSTQSQAACEDNSIVPIRSLESYFAIMFESTLR